LLSESMADVMLVLIIAPLLLFLSAEEWRQMA
jgi:hypothetical protein